jgi:signal transduction histidine kinase
MSGSLKDEGIALDEPQLRKLIEVGRSLVSRLDLESVLANVLEAARELTGARYAALGILGPDRTELERFLALGVDSETRAAIGELPRGRGVLGLLISDPRPLRLRDVIEHPRSFGFPPGHPPMSSFLGLPILIRGEAFGNLYLTEKRDGAAFTESDEAAAVVLAEWAAVAISNARLVAEDRLRYSISAAERERGRWARELHDETLQGLGALRVLLASGLRGGSLETLSRAAREVTSQLDSEIQNLRALIAELRPAALDEIGVEAAIHGLAERVSATAGLAVEAELSLPGAPYATQAPGSELESTIYRLVQEALTNVAKHSRAEHVRLRVVERDGAVEVSVTDDGVGFEPEAEHAGFGVPGMHERVAMVGGSLELSSAPGAGATMRAVIPVPR